MDSGYSGRKAMNDTTHEGGADQRPRHATCPLCPNDGAIDGYGDFTRTKQVYRASNQELTTHAEQWHEMHCPECDNRFAVLETVVP